MKNKNHAKVGKKEGRPTFRTPSRILPFAAQQKRGAMNFKKQSRKPSV